VLGRLRRLLGARQRSQGLVEYGLVAATVAFVGVASLGFLTSRQKEYLSGLPLDPPAPSAPGALLHPTSVIPPSCVPPSPVVVGTPITCAAPTVKDIFSNPVDQKPPWGTVRLYLDSTTTTPLGTCVLPHIASGGQNTCASTLSWTPDPSLAGTPHQLILRYEQPESNHVGSTSSPASITFLPQLEFVPTPQCDNPFFPKFQVNWVEIGHPLICVVNVKNAATHLPLSGVDITWTADVLASTGVPLLSCYTGGDPALFASLVWDSPPTPACAPSSTLTCTTDASGRCRVVYRRLRDLTGTAMSGPVGAHSLALTAFSGLVPGPAVSLTVSPPGVGETPPNPTPEHPSLTFVRCLDTAGVVQTTMNVRKGHFPVTDHINVASGTTLTCSATVIDLDANPALDCDSSSPWSCSGNPDTMDAHAPLGTILWDWPGGPPNLFCELQRLDSLGPSASMAPHQTPFASGCDITSLPVSGSSGTQTLRASYVGATVGATHTASEDHFDVTFP
jgi:hypothetical protein